MIATLIHHRTACLIVLLLIALAFLANRLGLITWLAWLDRREEKHFAEATKDYWRLQQ
jgi:hypothetical protein